MKLTNAELKEGYEKLKEYDNIEISGELVWAVIANTEEIEPQLAKYQKSYERLVQDQIVKDEDGNPVYPEGKSEERGDDPKFEDKQQLLEDLQGLLEKEVEVDIETVTRQEFLNGVKKDLTPKDIRPLMFMIE